MRLDAIIISGWEDFSFAQSNSMRLKIGSDIATVQLIHDRLKTSSDPKKRNPENPQAANWHHAPKLNGAALFSYLSARNKSCAVIDSFSNEKDRFKHLLGKNPKYIIVSTTFITTKPSLSALVQQIRQLAGDIIIIAGGPLVLTSYLLYARRNEAEYDTDSPKKDYLFLEQSRVGEPTVDYYIIGNQGLDVLCRLMDCLDKDLPVTGLPSVVYKEPNGFRFSKEIFLDTEYEQYSIDWRALPSGFFAQGVANLQASNGCPYNCRFCNFVKSKRATFVRPMDDIIQDMLTLQAMGIRYLRFVDDNFRLGKPDLETFCHRLIDEGVRIKWMSFMRLSNLKGVDLNLLRTAGFIEAQFGLESANKGILDDMNKRIDPELYQRLIKDLLFAGINVSACFIIGFPGETLQTAQETIDFIRSVDYPGSSGYFTWSLFPFMVAPLSPIYEQTERAKYQLDGYLGKWRHATMDSTTASEIVRKAYLQIDTSGPTYAGDNLDLLFGMSPPQRKQFHKMRHALSKKPPPIALNEIRAALNECF